MTKKVYKAPYLKVVSIKNDILTSSTPGMSDTEYDGPMGAQGRHGMWDDDFDAEDVF